MQRFQKRLLKQEHSETLSRKRHGSHSVKHNANAWIVTDPTSDGRMTDSEEVKHSDEDFTSDEIDIDMKEWERFKLTIPILKAIRMLGFQKPTPIQVEALIYGLEHRKDIIAASETV
jgi:hypothetical protein